MEKEVSFSGLPAGLIDLNLRAFTKDCCTRFTGSRGNASAGLLPEHILYFPDTGTVVGVKTASHSRRKKITAVSNKSQEFRGTSVL